MALPRITGIIPALKAIKQQKKRLHPTNSRNLPDVYINLRGSEFQTIFFRGEKQKTKSDFIQFFYILMRYIFTR